MQCHIQNHLKSFGKQTKENFTKLISPTQSAFVPGQLITNNILVAYESLHIMHGCKKGKKVSLILKLDISKTYGRVEWAFLKSIMVKMGFPEAWIEQVICFVSTSSFSTKINGKAYGNIIPSRRLQQGDPLSPYLFLLCAKGFTSLLAKAEMENWIHRVFICKRAPSITHLLFVDDSLLVCQAN